MDSGEVRLGVCDVVLMAQRRGVGRGAVRMVREGEWSGSEERARAGDLVRTGER